MHSTPPASATSLLRPPASASFPSPSSVLCLLPLSPPPACANPPLSALQPLPPPPLRPPASASSPSPPFPSLLCAGHPRAVAPCAVLLLQG
eukprot:366475-Chlamydomonas_euryale.AAC.2